MRHMRYVYIYGKWSYGEAAHDNLIVEDMRPNNDMLSNTQYDTTDAGIIFFFAGTDAGIINKSFSATMTHNKGDTYLKISNKCQLDFFFVMTTSRLLINGLGNN